MYPRHLVSRLVPRSRIVRPAQFLALGVLAALLVLSACATTTGGSPSSTSTATSAPTSPAATNTPTSYPVKVYFSKHPDSDNDVNAVFAVNRVSPTLGVAQFALQQLIAGPTASETAAGYYTELTASLTGSSNCGGADFQLFPDHKGTTVSAPGTMTIKFCRATQLAGDLTGSRIVVEITKTMLQFSNIHSVVILNSSGDCFNDFQGANACLN